MESPQPYSTVLVLHSLLRAAVVVLALGCLLRAFTGWRTARAFDGADRRWWLFLTIATDLQLTLGLLLYFVWSPVAQLARNAGAEAMKDPVQRFWGMEHMASMLLFVVLVHAAKITAKKSVRRPARGQFAAFVMLLVGFALVAKMTPWPWSKHEGVQRPVVRGLG